VPTAGAAACGEKQFMFFFIGGNFFYYAGQGLSAPVANRLAADLKNIDVRKEAALCP
jgi:hypothetical protein